VYVDLRLLVSYPQTLKMVGEAFADKCKEIGCDRIAGIPYAGVPLGVAASIAGNIPMIYPRKEIKAYGTGKTIEGAFNSGEKVIVIDDLITDGASKIEAIKPLEEAGLVVKDALVILDREQGGKKLLADAGYTLHSLGTLSDFLDALPIEDDIKIKVREFIRENQFKK
jgi:orotate phosphoribosyltransferase